MKSTESKTVLITSAVEKYLKKNIHPERKNKILIAFSSGPDSTVILDVLCRLSEKYSIEIVCAYYNHKLRKDEELAREISIAEENCRLRNIRLIKGFDDGSIEKEIPKLGTEGAARKYRYLFLEKVFKEEKCDFTASGHNLDDQIETVVMRLFKGSGAAGLKGIPEKNGKFIRPLISVSKKDIMEYLEENNIKYSIDNTNNEEVYIRNRIRHTLLPAASEIFPGFEKSVISLSEKMVMTEKYIKKEAEKKIIWKETEDGLYTDFDNFFRQEEIIQLESLYNAADILDDNKGRRIPYTFLKPVLQDSIRGDGGFSGGLDGELLKLKGKNSSVYLEGYGLTLFRTGKKLFFKKSAVSQRLKPFTVDTESKKRIYPISKNRYICIEENVITECSESDLWINPENIQGKLYIRYRENGDRIFLKGGKKKIKKLFTEMGIQKDHKDRIPLICDNTGILAVMGSAFGYRDRISERIYVNKSSNSKVIIFRTRQV